MEKIKTLEEVNHMIDKYNEMSDNFNGDWEELFFVAFDLYEANSKRTSKIIDVLFENLDELPKPVIEILQKYSNAERNNLKGK